MLLTGSEIILQCLLEQKVDTIFGYPGGAVLNIYDALYNCPQLRHVLVAHEQGAAHAADGYARSTGKVGVCLATSGPGATNLVTGIATAYMDSSPVVAITGNVTSAQLGLDSFQEVDITSVTMPVTKHNFLVRRVEELADTIRLIRDTGVTAVFAEPQYSESAARIISDESGATLYFLDPVVTGEDDADSYLNAMKHNLEVLKTALA